MSTRARQARALDPGPRRRPTPPPANDSTRRGAVPKLARRFTQCDAASRLRRSRRATRARGFTRYKRVLSPAHACVQTFDGAPHSVAGVHRPGRARAMLRARGKPSEETRLGGVGARFKSNKPLRITFGPRFADRKSSVDPLNARVLKPSSDRRSRSSKPGRFQSTRTRDTGCGMKKRERLPLAACRHIATRECTHRASSSLRWVPPCTPRRSSCVMRRWTSRTGTSARTS